MAEPHVEITGGIVTAQTRSDAIGARPVFDAIGERRFFVDAVEADGGRIGMWDGPSYEAAILEAEAMSAEFGPVVDMVVSGKS
jgi:hypothetical protein